MIYPSAIRSHATKQLTIRTILQYKEEPKGCGRYMVGSAVGFDTTVIGTFPNACVVKNSCDVGKESTATSERWIVTVGRVQRRQLQGTV